MSARHARVYGVRCGMGHCRDPSPTVCATLSNRADRPSLNMHRALLSNTCALACATLLELTTLVQGLRRLPAKVDLGQACTLSEKYRYTHCWACLLAFSRSMKLRPLVSNSLSTSAAASAATILE